MNKTKSRRNATYLNKNRRKDHWKKNQLLIQLFNGIFVISIHLVELLDMDILVLSELKLILKMKKISVKTIHKTKIKKEIHLLRRELDILQTVDPNIIKFYETYEDSKYFHIVMELCEGGELFDRIIEKGKYSEKEAAKVM